MNKFVIYRFFILKMSRVIIYFLGLELFRGGFSCFFVFNVFRVLRGLLFLKCSL